MSQDYLEENDDEASNNAVALQSGHLSNCPEQKYALMQVDKKMSVLKSGSEVHNSLVILKENPIMKYPKSKTQNNQKSLKYVYGDLIHVQGLATLVYKGSFPAAELVATVINACAPMQYSSYARSTAVLNWTFSDKNLALSVV